MELNVSVETSLEDWSETEKCNGFFPIFHSATVNIINKLSQR